MNPVLFIFLDGVGIGKKDEENNPFFKYGFKTFMKLFGAVPTLDNPVLKAGNKYIFPIDPILGVEGLPQSGTGQTSIYCGVNAQQLIGKHFGPYPYSTLIPVIKEQNLFLEVLKMDKKPFFANAYPKIFFDYLKSGKQRLGTTAQCSRLSGMRLNRVSDVRRGKAVTAEITNERWNTRLGYSLPVIRPATAAKRLIKIAMNYDFTVYEYFLTDHLGHGRLAGEEEKTLNILDEFLYTLLTNIDLSMFTLLICSDHGNLEDMSIKTHTLNPSLTLAAGKHAGILFEEIKDISQIKGAILKIIDE